MTSIKTRIKHLSIALVLAVSTLASSATGLLGVLSQVAHAAGATVVWTGTAGDNKLGTAGNWQGGVAPVAGDTLEFDGKATGSGTTVSITNDIDSTAFAGIVLKQVTAASYNSTTYALDKVTLSDGASLTKTGSGNGDASFSLWVNDTNGVLTAQGALTDDIGVSGVLNVAGSLTVASFTGLSNGSHISGDVLVMSGGILYVSNGITVDGTVTVQNGGTLSANGTYTGALILGGGTGSAPSISACSPGGCGDVTFSGPITLQSDALVYTGVGATAKVTGTITANGHTLTKDPNSDGTVIIGSETVENPVKTTPLDGDQPSTDYTVVDKETAILNGTRSYVRINSGGLLKGNGTVNSLLVYAGGTVSPGNSPGKITVINNFDVMGGTYQAEILSKDAYDQVVANSVNLGSDPNNGTLNLVFLPGGSVTQGDTFTIIDNTGTNPVTGIFKGLPEGTKMTVGNAVFAISYVGGDGNDVVLTALTTAKAPAAPNTGFFAPILASPLLVAALGVASIVALAIVRKTAKR